MTTQRNQGNSDNRGSGSANKDKQRELDSKSGRAGSDDDSNSQKSGTRGGTPEQHAKAGRQSHKNS